MQIDKTETSTSDDCNAQHVFGNIFFFGFYRKSDMKFVEMYRSFGFWILLLIAHLCKGHVSFLYHLVFITF